MPSGAAFDRVESSLARFIGPDDAATLMSVVRTHDDADPPARRSDVALLRSDVTVLRSDVEALKGDVDLLRLDNHAMRQEMVTLRHELIASFRGELNSAVTTQSRHLLMGMFAQSLVTVVAVLGVVRLG